MSDRKFSEEHEWIDIAGDVGTVGITNYAQEQLGDIVFVDLPEDGQELVKGDEAAVLESVKAASEIYAPATGTIRAVNEALNDEPGLVNSSPQDKGWFFKMSIDNASELEELMDEAAYKSFVESLG